MFATQMERAQSTETLIDVIDNGNTDQKKIDKFVSSALATDFGKNRAEMKNMSSDGVFCEYQVQENVYSGESNFIGVGSSAPQAIENLYFQCIQQQCAHVGSLIQKKVEEMIAIPKNDSKKLNDLNDLMTANGNTEEEKRNFFKNRSEMSRSEVTQLAKLNCQYGTPTIRKVVYLSCLKQLVLPAINCKNVQSGHAAVPHSNSNAPDGVNLELIKELPELKSTVPDDEWDRKMAELPQKIAAVRKVADTGVGTKYCSADILSVSSGMRVYIDLESRVTFLYPSAIVGVESPLPEQGLAWSVKSHLLTKGALEVFAKRGVGGEFMREGRLIDFVSLNKSGEIFHTAIIIMPSADKRNFAIAMNDPINHTYFVGTTEACH